MSEREEKSRKSTQYFGSYRGTGKERENKREEDAFKEVFYLRDLCWNFKSCS